MKTWLTLKNANRFDLPVEFQDDDVRYAESLVEHFLQEYTNEGDVVLDPFAGYGTTLLVAEQMGRTVFGVESDARRVHYVRSLLQHPENLVHGDSRELGTYGLPPVDLSITSPPYMTKGEQEDPFSNYATRGDYTAYLRDIRLIYKQVRRIMKPHAKVVIEVANMKTTDGVTTLAWDVAKAVSVVLRFEGEVVAGWDCYGYGYDHSYCLIFTNPEEVPSSESFL